MQACPARMQPRKNINNINMLFRIDEKVAIDNEKSRFIVLFHDCLLKLLHMPPRRVKDGSLNKGDSWQ
jgi:hypothetical protein